MCSLFAGFLSAITGRMHDFYWFCLRLSLDFGGLGDVFLTLPRHVGRVGVLVDRRLSHGLGRSVSIHRSVPTMATHFYIRSYIRFRHIKNECLNLINIPDFIDFVWVCLLRRREHVPVVGFLRAARQTDLPQLFGSLHDDNGVEHEQSSSDLRHRLLLRKWQNDSFNFDDLFINSSTCPQQLFCGHGQY